jgi:hypothetical protein
MLRTALLTTLSITLLLAPLHWRSTINAQLSLEAAETAARSGNWNQQVDHLSNAASWRGPFNTSATIALDTLRKLSTPSITQEQQLQLYQAERRALLKSRSWTHILTDSNASERIAELTSREAKARSGDSPRIQESSPPEIRHLPQLLSQIFFLLWILFIVRAIFQGIRMDGSTDRSPLMQNFSLAAVSYALWLSALLYV